MKISQICIQNPTFNGLWSKRERPVGCDMYTTYTDIENFYYPFSDETKPSIDDAIREKTYCITSPGLNDFETEEVNSTVKVMEKLPFTAEEFHKYKTFYGKTLTEDLKKIEGELKARKLFDSLNGGIRYEFKKFLYKLKLIK